MMIFYSVKRLRANGARDEPELRSHPPGRHWEGEKSGVLLGIRYGRAATQVHMFLLVQRSPVCRQHRRYGGRRQRQ